MPIITFVYHRISNTKNQEGQEIGLLWTIIFKLILLKYLQILKYLLNDKN